MLVHSALISMGRLASGLVAKVQREDAAAAVLQVSGLSHKPVEWFSDFTILFYTVGIPGT